MRIFCTFFYILISYIFSIGQNCGFTIEVPQDITICEPMDISLDGIINGNFRSFNWTSQHGYFNNINLSPSVFVDRTTTFTLKAFAEPTSNLIVNGDFSQGNSGFTTQYTYMQDVPGFQMELWNEGTYTVHDNPNDVHSNFSACSDQSGDGNMMILNGGGSFQQIWCQNVTVQPNTTYIFSAWGTSVHPASPAVLQFSINGGLLGTQLPLSSSTCTWQEFFTTWESGGNTSIEICIVNNNTALSGNDFAIDNLFFGPLCQDEMSFTVTLDEFEIENFEPNTIDCITDLTSIIAIVNPNLGSTYEWGTTNGQIVINDNTETITVSSSGLYTVTVTSPNGCTQEANFEVFDDLLEPDIIVIGDFELDCTTTNTILTATTTYSFTEITWERPNRNIESGPTISANVPGFYNVSITGVNGCVGTNQIEIVRNIPDLQYEKLTDSLTCTKNTAIIHLNIFNAVDSITWVGDTIIHINDFRDSIVVGASGAYYFTLHLGNDCQVTDSIVVHEIFPDIDYDISTLDTLNCNNTYLDVYITHTQNVSQVIWSNDEDLNLESDTLRVNIPGTYYISVLDDNGCLETDTIDIAGDFELPAFSVTLDSIDCINNFGRFYISTDSNFTVIWEGNSFSSSDRDPIINTVGEYTITVLSDNGCSDTQTYSMPTSQNYPIISTLVTHISCTSPDGHIEINVNVPSDILWTGSNGMQGVGSQIQTQETGDFIIEATTAQGCRDTFIVSINADTISPTLSINVHDTLTCSQLSTVPSVLAQDYTYLIWTGPNGFTSNELSPNLSVPGQYSVLITNEVNGCQNERIISVAQDISKPSFTVDYEDLDCNNPTTLLQIYGNNSVTYIINGIDDYNSNYSIAVPGQYTIRALAPNGCDSTIIVDIDGFFDTHPLNVPEFILNCYNDEYWAIDNNYDSDISYNWIIEGQSIQADSLLVNGAVNITLEATNLYGCKSSWPLQITENFEKPIINILGDNIIGCNDEFILLTANASVSNVDITWSNQDNIISKDNILEVSTPGNYELTAIDLDNGCENRTYMLITQQRGPDSVDIEIFQPLCFGERGSVEWNLAFGGTLPYTFSINNQPLEINSSRELTPGPHKWTIVDANGCTLSSDINIENPEDFFISAGEDKEINLGDAILLDGQASLPSSDIQMIQWSPSSSLSCSGCLRPQASPDADTDYQLIIIDSNGCEKTDNVKVRVKILKGHVAPNIFYPTSSMGNNRFTVTGLYESVTNIKFLKIYDGWGNNVFSTKNITPGDLDMGWNGSHLGSEAVNGVYVWIAELEYRDNSSEIVKGDITLMR